MQIQPYHVTNALFLAIAIWVIWNWVSNWLYKPMARPDFLSKRQTGLSQFPDQSGSSVNGPDYLMPRRDDGVMLTILAASALVPNPSADDSDDVRPDQDGANRHTGLPGNDNVDPGGASDNSSTYGSSIE